MGDLCYSGFRVMLWAKVLRFGGETSRTSDTLDDEALLRGASWERST